MKLNRIAEIEALDTTAVRWIECPICGLVAGLTRSQAERRAHIACPQCRQWEVRADPRKAVNYDRAISEPATYNDAIRVRRLRLAEKARRQDDASSLLCAPVNVAPRSRAV